MPRLWLQRKNAREVRYHCRVVGAQAPVEVWVCCPCSLKATALMELLASSTLTGGGVDNAR